MLMAESFKTMLKNYLKIAFRNLRKNPGYSFINIGGLAIGIICCLLIFQFVAFEYSFDDFNDNAQNLYRVNRTSGDSNVSPLSGYAMGPAMVQEVPEIEHAVRLHPEYGNPIVSNPGQPDKTFKEENVYYTDPSFLRMFTYPLVSGDVEGALTEPGTALLSETAAEKYFGEKENPIGQTLDVHGWVNGTYQVNGVFQDVPANSHLQFDILLPIADLLQRSYQDPRDSWNWTNFITYVQLRTDAAPAETEQKMTGVLTRNLQQVFGQANEQIMIQPLQDIHLNDDIIAPKAVMGSYQAIYFFIIIGVVILLIALVNYINLTTARSLKRAREVEVRKAIGAQKQQLTVQFLCESALTILIATAFAAFLADLLMPVINTLAGTNLTNAIWLRLDFWMILTAMSIVAIVLAGLYPAFILSSFKPTVVLKGKTGTSSAGTWLRQGLVVFQFAAAIVLLTGTVIVYTQLNYMQNMDLGINLEQILSVSGPRVLPEDTDQAVAIETFTQELRRLPSVRQTATSNSIPGRGHSFITVVGSQTDPSEEIRAAGTSIDADFASLYGLELVAGEGFANMSIPTDGNESRPIIATETAIRAVGFNSPEEAIGQEAFTGRIVGVFKDFNWSSAHEAPANVFFVFSKGERAISIKVDTENLPQTISSIEAIYHQHFPGNPFQYTFVDEQFDQQYRNDQRFASLFSVFAGLAIMIACLGLFGLAAFTAEQRTKEIGVRKVLGASVMNIVGLMGKDFILLVFTGFVIAVPIVWYVMGQWLADFAYRIEIGPGVFAISGGSALLIALATVSWQSVRAAVANPVESLRSE